MLKSIHYGELQNDEPKSPNECPICLCQVNKKSIYVILNGPDENKHYHVKCIQDWFDKSFIRPLSQKCLGYYSVYDNRAFVTNIDLPLGQAALNDLKNIEYNKIRPLKVAKGHN